MHTAGKSGDGLTSLLYRSRATAPLAPSALRQLVDNASERNRRAKISGALFYENGDILQWIEGDRQDVSDLFDAVKADPRHENVEVLSAGPVAERSFGDWGMRLFERREALPDDIHMTEPCNRCNRACQDARGVALSMVQGLRDPFRDALLNCSDELAVRLCYCEQVLDQFAQLWATDACSFAQLSIGHALALSTLRDVLMAEAVWSMPAHHRPVMLVPMPGEPNFFQAELARRVLQRAGHPVVYRVVDAPNDIADELDTRGDDYAALVIVGRTMDLEPGAHTALKTLCRSAKSALGLDFPTSFYARGRGPIEAPRGLDHQCTSARLLPDFLSPLVQRVH